MITETCTICRYCDVCATGEDVSTTVCEVCCNTGGAYKALDKPGKWIHSLCASWIPEIYSVDVKNEIFLTTKGLDRKRFKLKCVLCSGKGACIQCSYGKCCIPAHPWCVLHTPKGFTRRVIKDEDDEMVWDIFCKVHASAVSEPLKPKVKQKVINLTAAPIQEPSEDKMRKKGVRKESKPQYSMSHSVRKSFPSRGIADHSQVPNGCGNMQSKKIIRLKDSDDENDYENESDDDCDKTTSKPTGTSKSLQLKLAKNAIDSSKAASTTAASSSSSSASIASVATTVSFPLLTLVEWPGQVEGEAMDLDHFWNVAAMHYPEDHPVEVKKISRIVSMCVCVCVCLCLCAFVYEG